MDAPCADRRECSSKAWRALGIAAAVAVLAALCGQDMAAILGLVGGLCACVSLGLLGEAATGREEHLASVLVLTVVAEVVAVALVPRASEVHFLLGVLGLFAWATLAAVHAMRPRAASLLVEGLRAAFLAGPPALLLVVVAVGQVRSQPYSAGIVFADALPVHVPPELAVSVSILGGSWLLVLAWRLRAVPEVPCEAT